MATTEDVTEGKKFKRMLPCDLTDQEMKKKGKRAGEMQAEADTVRQEMNDAVAGHKKDLKEINGKLRVLLSELESGKEERNVECFERKDFKRKKAEVVRTDSNEVVETRTMEAWELQEKFPQVSDVKDVAKQDESVWNDDVLNDGDHEEERVAAKKNGRGKGKGKK